MSSKEYKDPYKSLILYGLKDKLDFLIKLYDRKKLPRVLMITGEKGIGKSTLISHFLNYIYDKENYDLEKNSINDQTKFFKQYICDIFPNIIYLSGDNFKNIRIDDIRELKSKILKSTILKKKRFIILDDIELFNINSLNGLLKIIEEPSSENYFVLINNKSKPLIKTIYSRSLEIKVLLNNEDRVKIIESLIEKNNLDIFIDFNLFNLTPGKFLLFNRICSDNKINVDDNYLKNFKTLLSIYKKNKNIDLINMILFLTDYHFYNRKTKNQDYFEKIIQDKSFIINNINKFIEFNLNQTSLINSVTNRLSNG
tara:strand:- start:457 stop:1392 length:936 start_codon:yes stop_codon:yes gene_type:complete